MMEDPVNTTKSLINFQKEVFSSEPKTVNQTMSEDNENPNQDLRTFNSWNYVIDSRKIGKYMDSNSNSNKGSIRRSKSCKTRRKRGDIEYHPQMKQMLSNWKRSFNNRKTKQSKVSKRESRQKLSQIKCLKNDELCLLDIESLVYRNLCKDDLFVPRKSFRSNDLCLILKMRLAESSIDKNDKHKLETEENENIWETLSSCSRNKNAQIKRELDPEECQHNKISEIEYCFDTEMENQNLQLDLRRVKFYDQTGSLVLL